MDIMLYESNIWRINMFLLSRSQDHHDRSWCQSKMNKDNYGNVEINCDLQWKSSSISISTQCHLRCQSSACEVPLGKVVSEPSLSKVIVLYWNLDNIPNHETISRLGSAIESMVISKNTTCKAYIETSVVNESDVKQSKSISNKPLSIFPQNW